MPVRERDCCGPGHSDVRPVERESAHRWRECNVENFIGTHAWSTVYETCNSPYLLPPTVYDVVSMLPESLLAIHLELRDTTKYLK